LPGFLVDTNILVYSYDPTDGEKRRRAIEVLDVLGARPDALLSTQVLGEFFVTITRKIPHPLSPAAAARRIEHYIESWSVCDVTASIVAEAVRGVISHKLSYYDSLIWATARLNQMTSLVTEDGQHNRLIEGVRYLNPFHPDFDLSLIAS
jgi:predicted nucleic acid-binding protein